MSDLRPVDVDWSNEDRGYYLGLKEEADEQIANIRAQVKQATRRAASTGEYADSDWLTRAEAALRHAGRLSQMIQNRLSDLKQKHKYATQEEKSWERTFVNIAQAMLPQSLWIELRQATDRKLGRLQEPA